MLAKSFLSLLLFGLAVSALPFPQGSSDGDENPATANDGDGSGSNGGNGTLNGINNGNTLASNLLDNDNTGNLGITNSGNVQIGSSCDKKVHQVCCRATAD